MQSTLRITTKVLPGKRVEVSSPELREGESVDVILVMPERPDQPRHSILDIIKSLDGQRLFRTPEEVDAYLREERGSWDR